MKRLGASVLIGSALNGLVAHAGETAPSLQFYAGVSAGYDRMIAKRTEKVKTAFQDQFFFSNNKTQTGNGFNGKLLGGFLWNIAGTSFAIGPEAYVGYGSAEVTLQEKLYDANILAQTERYYQSTFKQTFMMGAILRMGYYLNQDNNFLYVLGGINCSRFENRFTFSSFSIAMGVGNTINEKQSKFLKSPIVGVGFEKKCNRIKIGLDVRYMPHSAWGNYSRFLPRTDDTVFIRFKPKIITTNLTLCYLF